MPYVGIKKPNVSTSIGKTDVSANIRNQKLSVGIREIVPSLDISVSNVKQIETTYTGSGIPMGLLLALTYPGTAVTTETSGGFAPHVRILTS